MCVYSLEQLKFQEKRDNETDELTQAKDRAQLTATTAMSTVHVALLKAILDQGPESNKYYTVSIILISISLVLQVIAGLLSLVIAQIKSFYTKHRYVIPVGSGNPFFVKILINMHVATLNCIFVCLFKVSCLNWYFGLLPQQIYTVMH